MMQGRKFKYGLIFMAMVLLFASACQKVIDLKLDNSAPQLVIEGNLTDQDGSQVVTISKSVSFSATDTFPPVSGATVSISDSTGIPNILTEKAPGVYVIFPYQGLYGRTYTLTVKVNGVTYTALSTMPMPVPLDSLGAKSDDIGKKNLRTIVVNYQDPSKVANQYRFVLSINKGQVNTVFTNDDSFTNGRYVREELFQTGMDIHHGDTARVEMQCIEKNIYKYWFSLSPQQNNGPGGGITPSTPPSNINNGALGYFSAHTVSNAAITVN
jgi:hypothetical protein